MKEREFATKVNKWLREQRKKGEMLYPLAIEYKIVNAPKKSISFVGDFQPQQIPALKQAKDGCIYHKLSDLDPRVKPFDAIQICHSYAYIVILFNKPRQKKIMHWVDVDDWLELQNSTNRKSATEEMIAKVSEKYTL